VNRRLSLIVLCAGLVLATVGIVIGNPLLIIAGGVIVAAASCYYYFIGAGRNSLK
jgi:NAD/NADP transhydrogenase beta subunit